VSKDVWGFVQKAEMLVSFVLKAALAVVALLWATVGHTAPVPTCYPGERAHTAFVIETQPQTLFAWALAPKASFTVTWFCDEKYDWHGYGWAGWKSELTPDWLEQFNRLSTADHATRDAAWNQYLKQPIITPADPVYGELAPIIYRQFNLTRPPPILWRVKDNPTSTTRPVYGLTATGARNTVAISGVTVSDSAPCDCKLKAIEEVANTYCDVSAQLAVVVPDRVALCIRVN
jgi:hypothetical protein